MDPLHDYWEASTLNRLTISGFARQVIDYEPDPEVIDPLAGSAEATPLRLKRDRLQRDLETRRSSRSFAPTSLSDKQLGQVLGALRGDRTQRTYPSAGGLGSVEVFALLDRVASPIGRRCARYLPAEHALAPLLSELPSSSEIDELCSLEGSSPALVLIFAIRLDHLTRKYGSRGARFGLIEVGHACQNLALRLSNDNLAGYQLGGVLDQNLEELLGLSGTPAKVTLGYAIGHQLT